MTWNKRPITYRALSCAALAISLLLPGVATAEQRALLVGVGKYKMPGHDLPGIDLDLQTMRESLNLLGFEDSQIKTLLDEEATSGNVKEAMRSWLTDGVGPNDRVVFYYSGHGAYIVDEDGDEKDSADEVLVTHDVYNRTHQGRATLGGVIRDDEIGEIIANIASRNVWTIIDACHSGTATRAFTMDNLRLGADPMFSRSFTYPGMPTGSDQSVIDRPATRSLGANFVSISAAADSEKALGNSNGGIFTIGLSKAIRQSAHAQRDVSVLELRDSAAAYIEQNVDPDMLYHPQVTGNVTLAEGALPIVPLVDGNGPNWKRLVDVADGLSDQFPLATRKSTYRLGEAVAIELEVPVAGYLNVVTVDSRDEAVVLFPNQYHSDNKVEAGSFRIPTASMAFELPASEPLGGTLVVGFVTEQPINFYQQSLDGRNADGIIEVDFTQLSPAATRAIQVAPKSKPAYAAVTEIEVVGR